MPRTLGTRHRCERRRLAQALVRRGGHGDHAHRAAMGDPLSAYYAAMELLRQRQYDQGAASLRKIIDGGLPANLLPSAFANLGTALATQRRHGEAISALRKAVAARQASERAYSWM